MLVFYSEQAAKEFIKTPKGRSLKVRRAYKCTFSQSGIWHVTTKLKKSTVSNHTFRMRVLERELHQEMSGSSKKLTEAIAKYMQDLYEHAGIYKVSSKMVYEFFKDQYPKATIYQQLSIMKNSMRVITSLDEKVPDQKGAKYFALNEVLDKVTQPAKETVVDNSSEILAKLNGMVQGYAELVPAINSIHEVLTAFGANTESKLNEIASSHASKTDSILFALDVIQTTLSTNRTIDDEHFKTIASSHVTVNGDQLADVINDRLSDRNYEKSLIRNISEYFFGQTEDIKEMLDKLEDPSNSDEYKRGLRDGIKMAAELGITLKQDM